MEIPLFFTAVSIAVLLCAAEEVAHGKEDLHLLVLSPYPSQQFAEVIAWAGGPSVYPAAQLAADMINNRTDILPGYNLRLVNGDSGCGFTTRATVTFAREAMFHYYNRVVAIVGPACSSAAVEIGGITELQDINLVSLTVANGPQLRIGNYSNMFRLVSSSQSMGHALFRLMENNNWRSVAVIVDLTHWYYGETYNSFTKTLASTSNYTASAYPLTFNGLFPLSFIRNRFNVIFSFSSTPHVRESLCLASKWKLVYPDYQWVFMDVEESGLLIDEDVVLTNEGQTINCSQKEMAKALNQAIILYFRLTRDNKTSPTDVGLSYEEYLMDYEIYFNNHLGERNISEEVIPVGSRKWAPAYFDAVWALGLALNSSTQILKDRNMTLAKYQYGNESITSTIRDQLLKTKFRGISKNISFRNDTLEVPTFLDILQLDSTYPMSIKIGYYYEGELLITDTKNATFVKPLRNELRVVSPAVVIVFCLSAVLILLLVGSLHLVHFVFRHFKSIRAQSPHFGHLIFSGCYLYIISALLDTIRAANWTTTDDIDSRQFKVSIGTLCNATFWCLTLSTSLVFGTVCALSWRLYRIFTHYIEPGKWISDSILVSFVVALIMLNVTVLIAWSTYDPLLPDFDIGDEGLSASIIPVYVHCDCRYFSSWLWMWVLNGTVIVLVVALAILNRHVPRKDYFNNTRSHSFMIYVVSLLNGVCIPLYFIQLGSNRINLSYVFFQFFTLGSALITCLFLFVPPVIPLLKESRQSYVQSKTTLSSVL